MYLTSIITRTDLPGSHPAIDMDNGEKLHADHDEQVISEKRETTTSVIDSNPHAALGYILKTHPVNTWGAGSLHLYAICLLIYLCSTMNGMPPFQQNDIIYD
jgi:hypothetical protein